MDFKWLVLLTLLNLALSMPDPDVKVDFDVNLNIQDSDGPNNSPDNDKEASDSVKCGVVNPVPTRIVNGVDVNVARKYSWQVGLTKGRQYYNYCGGSILTNSYIITAAHCVCNRKIGEVVVRIGDHAVATMNENLPEFVWPIPAIGITVHETYVCGGRADQSHDIAIVKLSRAIDLVKHSGIIHPICLPKDDSKTYAGLTGTITGWGSTVGYTPIPIGVTADPPSDHPNILQEAQIPVLNNSRCEQLIGFDIQETMVCVLADKGFQQGGTGVCQGDSGGPLIIKEKEQHVQIGITSFGAGCASELSPSVFVRVSKYLRWIKEQVGFEKIYTLP